MDPPSCPESDGLESDLLDSDQLRPPRRLLAKRALVFPCVALTVVVALAALNLGSFFLFARHLGPRESEMAETLQRDLKAAAEELPGLFFRWGLPGLGILAAIGAVNGWTARRAFRCRIDEGSLRTVMWRSDRQGDAFLDAVEIPFSEVRRVDWSRDLADRLFGLCNVSIQGSGTPVVQLRGLSTQLGAAVRSRLVASLPERETREDRPPWPTAPLAPSWRRVVRNAAAGPVCVLAAAAGGWLVLDSILPADSGNLGSPAPDSELGTSSGWIWADLRSLAIEVAGGWLAVAILIQLFELFGFSFRVDGRALTVQKVKVLRTAESVFPWSGVGSVEVAGNLLDRMFALRRVRLTIDGAGYDLDGLDPETANELAREVRGRRWNEAE